MTQPAIAPNKASSSREITVMTTEENKALQKLKFVLLMTELRFVSSPRQRATW